MKKETRTIEKDLLLLNKGQIDWLPSNPREWYESDMERMRKSIREDPDFLEDRPALVVPFGDVFIVFAGNFRTEAARAEGINNIPCVIYYPEKKEDRLVVKRRAMKDNGSFGKWDYDKLTSEWEDLPLEEWGITIFKTDEEEKGEAGGGGSAVDVKEDDFDEEKDGILVRCKKGDIWELGDHRLMCGDSIDLEQVKTLMGGGVS